MDNTDSFGGYSPCYFLNLMTLHARLLKAINTFKTKDGITQKFPGSLLWLSDADLQSFCIPPFLLSSVRNDPLNIHKS